MARHELRPLQAVPDAHVKSDRLDVGQRLSAPSWPWLDNPLFKNWFELNRECCDFVMHRLQMDAALVHQLATCTSPQDMLAVYQKFFEKAFADYHEQSVELVRLATTDTSSSDGDMSRQ